ncbi:MAG TPA: hypothetical protein VEX38_08800 [Fimbriimonadaceae bacterium]|nr:hypothetical protein [Fimbriimonadaceae bacterium]
MRITSLIGGLGAGAALMYFLDPKKGAARRSRAKDKATAVLNAKMQAKSAMVHDARNRLKGIAASAKRKLSEEQVADERLKARVRSAIGHVVSHPRSIRVRAEAGNIHLSGLILADEVGRLMETASKVPGVQSVMQDLDVRESAEGVPELQGSTETPEQRAERLQEGLRPATALAVGLAGGVLALVGMTRKGPFAKALTATGMTLLSKSLKDTEGQRIAEHVGRWV